MLQFLAVVLVEITVVDVVILEVELEIEAAVISMVVEIHTLVPLLHWKRIQIYRTSLNKR